MVRLLPGLPRKVCITGARGRVWKGAKAPPRPKELIRWVLTAALNDADLQLSDLDGLVAVPSLTDPHFMEAHYQATNLGLFSQSLPERQQGKPLRVRTIDTGGAGPVSALLEAAQMIECENCDVVAVVAGDSVGSLPSEEFLKRADASCQNAEKPLPSPVIPHGYDKYTEFLLGQGEGSLTRDHLRLVPVLESWHSCRHPGSLTNKPLSLDQVRASRSVTPNISLLECARRADGAAAIVLASNRFLLRNLGRRTSASPSKKGSSSLVLTDESVVERLPVLLGGGEASGPLYPPERVEHAHFSSGEDACRIAYEAASLAPEDVDFFGLYDCFPVCFLKAMGAAGVVRALAHRRAKAAAGASPSESQSPGEFLEQLHDEFKGTSVAKAPADGPDEEEYARFQKRFPVNTHGGLLCFGAPWEVPAAFNVVEAVRQLTAPQREFRRGLVYGNGGIFSASAVAILGVR